MRIGFSLLRGGGGPTVFLSRLRDELERSGGIQTATFLDPRSDILLFANKARNPWRKPYVFRVDGFAFDSALTTQETNRRNADIVSGLKNAAGIVFQSHFDQAMVRRFLGVPDVPTAVIPNGVQLNVFSPHGDSKRAVLGYQPDDLVFITSAKWRAHKRLDAVISTFLQFRSRNPQRCRLIVLGKLDRPYQTDPDIHFAGHIPADDLPDWYRTADLCLFFSWLDHCPNTVVEALACGLPVVCTNQGGTRELIELTGGGLIAEADAPFAYEPVELYKPPQPNPEILLQAVTSAANRRAELSAAIARDRIDIKSATRHYLEFISRLVS